MYSDKLKVLFIAVPKTGSASFTRTFVDLLDGRRNEIMVAGEWLRCRTHATLRELGEQVGWDKIADMTIVAGVRNPWDRIVSSYFFYKNGRAAGKVMRGERNKPISIFHVFMAKILPFGFWVWLYGKKECMHHVIDQHGIMKADHIIHFDRMSEDIASLCEELGVSLEQMKHINKSEHNHYRDYYTSATRKLVAKRFANDIAEFGFIF